MSKPEVVKWVAPRGGLLVDAYRQEANLFEREGNERRAIQYRAFADHLQALVDSATKNQPK